MTAYTVWLTPKYKLSFLLVMTLPVCLFQACSVSYDMTVMSCVCVATACILRAIEEKDRPISSGRMLQYFVLMTLGTIAKPAYAPLLLLVCLLPSSRFGTKRRMWLIRGLALVLIVLLLGTLVLGAYDNVLGGDERFENTDSKAQVAWIFTHFGTFLDILGNYFVQWFGYLMTSGFAFFAYLGSMQPLSECLAWLMLLLAPLCTIDETPASALRLTGKRRLWCLMLGFVPILMLVIAQYCASNPVGSTTIEGMQQRYVLQVLPMFLLALMLPESWRRVFRKGNRLVALMAVVVWAVAEFVLTWQLPISSLLHGTLPL